MTTEKRVVEVPYLGTTGKPFHTLNEAQRRGYTRGILSEQDAMDLVWHCQNIAEAVSALQARRLELRKKAQEYLTFRQDTPAEERERRMKQVQAAKREYSDAAKKIEKLKGTVFTLVEGEPLVLEPIE